MSRPPSLAGDPRVRWGFLASTYSKGWFWYPRGYGILHCMDGLLQFEPTGNTPLRAPHPFQHTHRRVLLLSPFAIPNNVTVVVFEGGEVSISISGNRDKLRSVLTECGFTYVDAPKQRMYPFNQRKVWEQHMGPRVLVEELERGTVLGGVDKPMTHDFRCQACGGAFHLEYHDTQTRWYAATSASPPPPSPAAHWFDANRPLAPDETALDMTCPSCARPMRVIIHADEWRMSIWAYHLMAVLVLAPEQA